MRYFVALAFLLVIVVLCGATAFVARQGTISEIGVLLLSWQLDERPSHDSSMVLFVINKGESAAEIAERLEKERLITSALAFRVIAKARGVDAHIEAGEYQLRRNMTLNEVIDELQRNRFAGSRITFPEGWRAEEIADLIERRGIAKRTDFLSLVSASSFDADFLRGRTPGASLEGYLFPDTYRVPPGITAEEIVKLMLRNFGQRFDQKMREQAAAAELTIHEVVTLASIVEREAVVPEERPLIASVFLNRMRQGMPLQADPTVQYAVANANPASFPHEYWKRELTNADLAFDSPYNTYRYKGLPPGPIANPGLASIKAVLEPAQTDYFYFVASENGAHVFAKTLDEHNRNVQKYIE